jgi:heme-degrading monooxygenase HmoA
VWQSDKDPGELVMVSRWRDRGAFKAYMKSERHRISHARIDPVRSTVTSTFLASASQAFATASERTAGIAL